MADASDAEEEEHPLLAAAARSAAPKPKPAAAAAPPPTRTPAAPPPKPTNPGERRSKKKEKLYSGPRAVEKVVSLGNHQRYYGYRKKVDASESGRRGDARLRFLDGAWWRGAKAKDVGCNDGTFTAQLARRFAPRFLLGVDADAGLVRAAQASVAAASRKHAAEWTGAALAAADAPDAGVFSYGAPPFPHNLWFEREDAAHGGPGDHGYDVVSAFSVTKWIHLNHGDAGLRRFFATVFDELKPGGRFVYEPQPWKSYAKRKNASPEIRAHFDAMAIKPPDFPRVLEELGFASVVLLGTPDDEAIPKGFRRPIFLATKPGGGAEAPAGKRKRDDAAS